MNKFSYKLIFSYDGSRFFGSARQPDVCGVQNRLEEILKSCGIFAPTQFASRTDKGVHAARNVAKIIASYELDCKKVIKKINAQNAGIKALFLKKCEFEPRFDAKIRSYRYVFKPEISVFLQNYCTKYDKFIDIALLKKYADNFVGEHDFSAFCIASKDKTDKSKIRKISKIRVYKYKDFVVLNFFANGFVRGQIRLMVGFLLAMLEGKLGEKEQISQLKNEKIFHKIQASASGLYLKSVCY